MKEITLYTTDFCSFCERTKALLRKRGLSYTEVNLSRDHETRAELAARSGLMTFPQVFVDDVLVGGYRETASAAASGRLDDLLTA
jgi:glutaredoxin 3